MRYREIIGESIDDIDDEFERQYDIEDDNEDDNEDDWFVRGVRDVLSEHNDRADVDEINHVADNIRSSLNGGGEIYRVMRLPVAFIEKMVAGASLGQHWSTVDDFATDNLYDGHFHRDSPLYRFVAHADISDVELEHSTAFQIMFPEEHEVFLKSRASIKLLGIYEEGKSENLRPDLIGAQMRS